MKKFLTVLAAFVILCTGIAGMGTAEPVSAAVDSYSTYYSVPSLSSGLKIEPSLVFEPASFEEIRTATSASVKPATILLTVDAEMKVSLGGQQKSFKDVFTTYVKGKAIPAVRLDGTTADAFLNFLKNTYAISDVIAVSKDAAVLEKLYADEAGRIVNTVYDLTGEKLSADRYAEWPHIAAANKAGCNILMYDGTDENFPVVSEYVEAMTKVCWAYTENKTEAVTAIAAGAYGIASGSLSDMVGAVSVFTKPGFARAQYIAAHRGITTYANEQSLTGIMAAYNEGSTHVEIDIQITKDGNLVINHDENIQRVTAQASSVTVADSTVEYLTRYKLATYSTRYGDSFALFEDVVTMMAKTDVILIVELKLDNASTKAVENLKAIETLKAFMEKHPEIAGHWYAITFFAPYAEKMRELLPEIPVGYLGSGASGMEKDQDKPYWGGGHKEMNNVSGKIDFLRKYNVGLDESMQAAINTYGQSYLARGYTENTWTFEDTSHFGYKANVATSNKAEECAMLVKTISSSPVKMTAEQLASGKFTFTCTAYNGWQTEQECEFVVVESSATEAIVIPYIAQEYYTAREKQDPETGTFGLYGMPTKVTIG